jgi:TM2 domain-containing membrane protein YozV
MSHHISDVIFWGDKPDRNYYVFVVLSILFGFVGADHFYLRSYATGTQKFIMNFFTLGLWHWWDIAQIVGDGQKVRTEGLTGPFDWLRGIGRGVFTNLPAEGGPATEYAAPKSYLIYTFLAVFFGWLGLDKFYMGTWGQGLLKLISCFNIFLLLFGWLWVLWDAVHAFFLTDSILKDGISPPVPYSMLFTEAISAEVFKVRKVENTNANMPPVTFIDWTQANMLHPHEIVANVMTQAKNANAKIMEHATNATRIASTAANAAVVAAVNAANASATAAPATNAPATNAPASNAPATNAPAANAPAANAPAANAPASNAPATNAPATNAPATNAPATNAPATNAPATNAPAANAPAANAPATNVPAANAPATNAPAANAPATNAPATNAPAANAPATNPIASSTSIAKPISSIPQAQTGGGAASQQHGPGPVIAGALSALILAGGLKGFYDIISKQYG